MAEMLSASPFKCLSVCSLATGVVSSHFNRRLKVFKVVFKAFWRLLEYELRRSSLSSMNCKDKKSESRDSKSSKTKDLAAAQTKRGGKSGEKIQKNFKNLTPKDK